MAVSSFRPVRVPPRPPYRVPNSSSYWAKEGDARLTYSNLDAIRNSPLVPWSMARLWSEVKPLARHEWNRLEAEREVLSWFSDEVYCYRKPEECGALWIGNQWVFLPFPEEAQLIKGFGRGSGEFGSISGWVGSGT